MENPSQIIQTVIVVITGALFLAFFFISVFYRGRKVEIFVVNKRETEYGGLNSTHSKWTCVKHYTVNCRYKNSPEIHTLRCSFSIYNDLKPNKKYTVTVKMLEIIKLHRK